MENTFRWFYMECHYSLNCRQMNTRNLILKVICIRYFLDLLNRYLVKDNFWIQKYSRAGKVLALHASGLGFVYCALYGPMSIARSDPWIYSRSKPWAPQGGPPKRELILVTNIQSYFLNQKYFSNLYQNFTNQEQSL